MNREIKFRTWDGERMLYGIEQTYDTIRRWRDSNGAEIDQADTKFWSAPSFGHMLEAGVPIMQFTGLKDRNGKEIYEGDILEVSTEIGAKFRGPIEFEKEKGRFCVMLVDGSWGLHTDDRANEVIGNIYETPSPLKGKEG